MSGSPQHTPVHHAAPLLNPPSRRGWAVVAVLIALTTLPTLAVVFAGQMSLESPVTSRSPYRTAEPSQPVIVDTDRVPGRSADPATRPEGQPALVARRLRLPAPGTVTAGGVGGGGPLAESACPATGGGSTGSGAPASGGSGDSTSGGRGSGGGASRGGGSSDDEQPPPSVEPPPGGQFYDRVYDELDIAHPS